MNRVCMTEQVNFTLLEKIGAVEVRRYPRVVLATVTGMSDNGSFSLLFDYIQGNNRSRRKVPMTAPVISSAGHSERIPMTAPVVSTSGSFSFVLPSEYTGQNAPEPVDSRVVIQEIPERTVAVIVFRGTARERQLVERTNELLDFLASRSIKAVGRPFLMRYNPPFIPGVFRHNELGVEIISNSQGGE